MIRLRNQQRASQVAAFVTFRYAKQVAVFRTGTLKRAKASYILKVNRLEQVKVYIKIKLNLFETQQLS